MVYELYLNKAVALQMEIGWMQIYGNSYSYLIQFLEIKALYTWNRWNLDYVKDASIKL